MRTAFLETLVSLAASDERIWLLTGDLGYSVLEPFRDRFPGRYVNVGVAEQNMTGVAAGLAQTGKIVFTYSIANFPTLRCLEQIRNDVCHHELPVKIVSVGAGFSYGAHGYTHHGVEDLAMMRALPGMTVIAPGDPIEARLATRAIVSAAGPVYLRLGKGREASVHVEPPRFAIGALYPVRACHPSHVALLAIGAILADAAQAAERLAAHGVNAEVWSVPTLAPLDGEQIRAIARRVPAMMTLEEHGIVGGLGSAVAEVLAECPDARPRFRRFGVPSRVYHDVGSQAYLRRALMGDPVEAVLGLLGPSRD